VTIALANLLSALARILDSVLWIAILLVVIRALISWVNPDPYNPIVRFLVSATDPLLKPFREKLPLVAGGMDLSPLILIFVLYFLEFFLVQTLSDYSLQLRHHVGL